MPERLGQTVGGCKRAGNFTYSALAPGIRQWVWAVMRIAVLSDTHDKLPEKVCMRIETADEIWHLGDVCAPVVISTLETIAPVRVVLGNCDGEQPWPLTLSIKREGFRFHLQHIPTLSPPECDVFLHGHTHVARDEKIKGVRFLNPGCVARPKGTPPSFAWLTLEEGRIIWKTMII